MLRVPDQSRRARGRWGEDRAVAHLRRAGLHVVARNWRPAARQIRGELDIVARDPETGVIVICEVKARRTGGHGGAVAAVGPDKQARIRRLAECWLLDHGPAPQGVRFDVIAIDGVSLRHWTSAF